MTARKHRTSHLGTTRPRFNQRCAVRVTYTKNKLSGQWRAHGKYVLRNSAVNDAFASVGIEASADTLARWQAQGDERLWKIIVSPEFGERVDFKVIIDKLMQTMERDLGTKLEWLAVTHYNTEHPHAHVAVRGVRESGAALDLPRDYVSTGIRRIAEDLCTRQLGYRTEQDKFEAERREINRTRPTSLDRIIGRAVQQDGNASFPFSPQGLGLKGEQRINVQARLAFLCKAGLAQPTGKDTWSVRSDFSIVLKSMQQVADRQRTLAAHRTLASDPNLPVVLTDLKGIGSLQGRILGFGEDEQNFSKPYMLIEEVGVRVHLMYQSASIQAARGCGQLRVGSLTRLRADHQNPGLIIIAEPAQERSEGNKDRSDYNEIGFDR